MRQEKEAILVSACLLGSSCRYDGGDNACSGLKELEKYAVLIPFCAEIYGGLSTPREPSEIRDGGVWSRDGRDVTAQFEKGAQEAVKMAQYFGCRAAILKERSPSCGSHQIYDGTFTGTKINGKGRTAALLDAQGIKLFSEAELDQCMAWIQQQNR